jgi:hypothetical protein
LAVQLAAAAGSDDTCGSISERRCHSFGSRAGGGEGRSENSNPQIERFGDVFGVVGLSGCIPRPGHSRPSLDALRVLEPLVDVVCRVTRIRGQDSGAQRLIGGIEESHHRFCVLNLLAQGAVKHRLTVDYGIVLSGEIDLELDNGSTLHLEPGDIVVQRATAHAWYNRSQQVTRMLFVMVDAKLSDELASTLGKAALDEILH